MDKFVTISRPKVSEDFLCDKTVLRVVQNIVATNDTVCIYGDSGVGKTWLVNHVLRGLSRFDVTAETLKDLERVENSVAHVVVDDFELDKELLEKLKGGHRLSKGALLFVARSVAKIDFCNCVHFEKPDVGLMVKIGLKHKPKEPIPRLTKLAIGANGNIRTFLYSIDFSGVHDIFRAPKDFVADLLCGTEDPRKLIGSVVCEHGYVWGVIHDNYPDAPNVNYARVAECMSQSELIDSYIYEGNWELLPFFCLVSTIEPAIEIGHVLTKSKLRPGSAWTKFGNQRMRKNKLVDVKNRTRHQIDVDSLHLIMLKCKKNPEQAAEIFRAYNLRPPDVDFINHLALKDKLSASQIQALKKRVSCLATS
jgi:hypothetical protein